MKEAYVQGLDSEEDEDGVGDQITPRDVGHNIYILAHQVIKAAFPTYPLLPRDPLPRSGPVTAAAACAGIRAPSTACPLC